MTSKEVESLITDAMRAHIGVKSPPNRLEVDKTAVRMFARAVGHTDPVFYDEEAAMAAGYRSLPCPPGYMGTPVFDPRASELSFGPMSIPEPAVKLTRILNGGTEYEYFDDICAGDVLTSARYVSDIQERQGSIGRMLIVTSKTEFTNQDDKLVAIATGPLIRYWHRRKSMAVTWESVTEGMEIPSPTKNPSTQQLVQWAAASGDFYQIHYDKAFAVGTGLQDIIVHGALKNAFLGQLLHEWVGREGRIKKYGCSYRGTDLSAAETKVRGVVARKYEENGEKLVDVEVWVENAAGDRTTPGFATVQLI